MIYRRHVPSAPLNQFVHWFWFYEGSPPHSREHVPPEGTFEWVIDLREEPRKLFERDGSGPCAIFRRGWISGTHSRFIVIDALPNASMMGVHFKPGGATAFLGMPAIEVADQVVEMEAIWGLASLDLRERLLQTANIEDRFRLLETFLFALARNPTCSRSVDRRMDWAIQRLWGRAQVDSIASIADEMGISHKHFIQLFRQRVGLPPKLFCRIQRFQKVLAGIHARESVNWADIAYTCGYSDQSHFVHDFNEFSGINPSAYIREDMDDPNFVPIH